MHAYITYNYMEPDEPGYICRDCEKVYPDAEPLWWRFKDWFFGETRLGRWWEERGMFDE